MKAAGTLLAVLSVFGSVSAMPTEAELRGAPIQERDAVVTPGKGFLFYCATASCAIRSSQGCAVRSNRLTLGISADICAERDGRRRQQRL